MEKPLPVLRFSAIPNQDLAAQRENYEPVAEYLSRTLGVAVHYVPTDDYSASLEMFKAGDIELAWFEGLSGVQARAAVPGALAIVQGVDDPRVYSTFIASGESGLEPGPDFPLGLAGASFAFGAKSSTSGYLMPAYFIRQASGQSAEDFFEQPAAHSGGHAETVAMVLGGVVQAGVLSNATWDRMLADGAVDLAKVQAIWRSPVYAEQSFSVHPGMDAEFGVGFQAKLQAALLGMEDPALLAAFGRTAFVPAKNQDFERIEDVAVELDLLRSGAL